MKMKKLASRCLNSIAVLLALTAYAQAETVDITNNGSTYTFTESGGMTSGPAAPGAVAVYTKGTTAPAVQFVSHFEKDFPVGGGGFIAYHNGTGGTLPVAGDRLGYLLFGSKSGTTPLNSAGIIAHAEGPWSVTADQKNLPSYLSFQTTDFANYQLSTDGPQTRTERMRITASGNVGIGDYRSGVAPGARLEVKDGGIRINNSKADLQRPACNATTRGTFWVTFGDAAKNINSDMVAICLWKRANGVDEYKWRTVVSTGNGEHISGNAFHQESD